MGIVGVLTGTDVSLDVNSLVCVVLVELAIKVLREEFVRIGDDIDGLLLGIRLLGQGHDRDRQKVLEGVDIAVWQPKGVAIVQPVDGKVQVDVEIVVGVVMLIPDPVELLLKIDGALLVRCGRVDRRGFVGVKADNALRDSHDVLPDILSERERLEARNDISRIVY